jgi:hypothetical protein
MGLEKLIQEFGKPNCDDLARAQLKLDHPDLYEILVAGDRDMDAIEMEYPSAKIPKKKLNEFRRNHPDYAKVHALYMSLVDQCEESMGNNLFLRPFGK